ncbi:hypothetical protein D3C75_1260730 [compost metagenome]
MAATEVTKRQFQPARVELVGFEQQRRDQRIEFTIFNKQRFRRGITGIEPVFSNLLGKRRQGIKLNVI